MREEEKKVEVKKTKFRKEKETIFALNKEHKLKPRKPQFVFFHLIWTRKSKL